MKLSSLALGSLVTVGCASEVASVRESLASHVNQLAVKTATESKSHVLEQRNAQSRQHSLQLQRLLVTMPGVFSDGSALRFYITAGCMSWEMSATRATATGEAALSFAELRALNRVSITAPRPGVTRYCVDIAESRVVAAYHWIDINNPADAYQCTNADGVTCRQTGIRLSICANGHFYPHVVETPSARHLCY